MASPLDIEVIASSCCVQLRIFFQLWPCFRDLFAGYSQAGPPVLQIEASNGASHYGNEFGEPVITGFTRSFGMKLPNGERREWVKPIMFSGGIGSMEAIHTRKMVSAEWCTPR